MARSPLAARCSVLHFFGSLYRFDRRGSGCIATAFGGQSDAIQMQSALVPSCHDPVRDASGMGAVGVTTPALQKPKSHAPTCQFRKTKSDNRPHAKPKPGSDCPARHAKGVPTNNGAPLVRRNGQSRPGVSAVPDSWLGQRKGAIKAFVDDAYYSSGALGCCVRPRCSELDPLPA